MMHKSMITPATSPLFCNYLPAKCTLLLISTLHVWFIDVNGP